MTTDKGIELDHATFNMDKVGGVYLIHGSFIARGKSKNGVWKDRINYYLYKFKEDGVTQGVWFSNKCKGLYKGIAIKNR